MVAILTPAAAAAAATLPVRAPPAIDRIDRMMRAAPPMGFERGEHLYHEGDEVDRVLEIVRGVVTLYKTAVDGQRQLVGVRFPGDFLGTAGVDRHHTSAMAARATQVRSASRAELDAAMERDGALGRRLLLACRAELRSTRDHLMVIGSRSALGRVAALLVEISDRSAGGAPAFELPLTRGEMGDYLGLTLETVSRAIKRLKTLKIVALPRTDQVLVLDRRGLRALAEGAGEGAARGRQVL